MRCGFRGANFARTKQLKWLENRLVELSVVLEVTSNETLHERVAALVIEMDVMKAEKISLETQIEEQRSAAYTLKQEERQEEREQRDAYHGCFPRTGGTTCKLNEIIYDKIYVSLPDDCKLTFAQMFCNFDDLCPFKAPLYVNGKQFDFEKHVLNLLTDAERAEWWRLTVNHLKWKYIDTIKNGVKKAILLVFGRLPKKYWPDQHQEALQIARDHIRCTKGRVVEFTLEIITCDHFSSVLR